MIVTVGQCTEFRGMTVSDKNLVLVRGLPGSGKSTFASNLEGILADVYYFDVMHIEADMYFVRPDGCYDFNYKFLGKAHDWCFNEAVGFIHKVGDLLYPEPECVIVSNTFTQEKYMQKYISAFDEKLGGSFNLYIIECKGDYGSIHHVPEEVISSMEDKWEELCPDKYPHITFKVNINDEPEIYQKRLNLIAGQIVGNMS